MSSPPKSPSAAQTKSSPPVKGSKATKSSSSSVSFNSPTSSGTTRHHPQASSSISDNVAGSSSRNPPWRPTTVQGGGAQAESNRVEALWAKMQLTLEDVELSALGSTHVFGKAHNDALEELRAAQIALAKAWGKGELDDEFAAMDSAWSDGKGEAESGQGATGDGNAGGTEREVAEARKRREANERFFAKVGQGVEEVAGKLDEVAAAMTKVEMESREIWDDKDSFDSSSLAS